MNRTTLFFFLFSTVIIGTASPGMAGERHAFPQQGCSADPPMRDGDVACKYLGSPDDIPTYGLYYGRNGLPLLEFFRSAEVIQGGVPYQIAVNSFEGSNFANCYVFRNANNQQDMQSLAHAWEPIINNFSEDEKASIEEGDHTYYLCKEWKNGALVVEARWRRADFSYLVGTAIFSLTGTLSDISFKKDSSN